MDLVLLADTSEHATHNLVRREVRDAGHLGNRPRIKMISVLWTPGPASDLVQCLHGGIKVRDEPSRPCLDLLVAPALEFNDSLYNFPPVEQLPCL